MGAAYCCAASHRQPGGPEYDDAPHFRRMNYSPEKRDSGERRKSIRDSLFRQPGEPEEEPENHKEKRRPMRSSILQKHSKDGAAAPIKPLPKSGPLATVPENDGGKQQRNSEIQSAIKIQSLHRGNLARAQTKILKIEKFKEAALVVKAALKIQAVTRGKKARREVEAMRKELQEAREEN